MNERLRLSRPDDEKSLKALWKAVFEDSDSNIDGFFEYYFAPGSAMVMEYGDNLASAAHMIPIGEIVLPTGEKLPCSYIYSVATLPEYRGRGFGVEVTKAAVMRCIDTGYPANVICPASDGLFEYYKDRVGYRDRFYTEEAMISCDQLPVIGQKWGIDVISPLEYHWLRERCLEERPHIALNEHAISFQQHLSRETGSELYALHFGGEYAACAASERQSDGNVIIKELLLDEKTAETENRAADAVSLVASVLPAENYIVRMPCTIGGTSNGVIRRFAMMMPLGSWTEAESEKDKRAWFGFAFD